MKEQHTWKGQCAKPAHPVRGGAGKIFKGEVLLKIEQLSKIKIISSFIIYVLSVCIFKWLLFNIFYFYEFYFIICQFISGQDILRNNIASKFFAPKNKIFQKNDTIKLNAKSILRYKMIGNINGLIKIIQKRINFNDQK